MQSAVFAERLDRYANEIHNGRGPARWLRKLAVRLRSFGRSSVAQVLADVRIVDDVEPERCQDANLVAARILEDLREHFSTAARRSAGRDFSALRRIAAQRPDMSIRTFVQSVLASLASNDTPRKQATPAMDIKQVEHFVSELEASYKEPEAFKAVFEDVKAAPLSREEIVEIASRFMGKMAKSASKQAALKRIWARHAALMDNRAKRRAFGGRTAA